MGGLVRGEVGDRRGDLRRRADAALRDRLCDSLPELVRVSLPVDPGLQQRCRRQANPRSLKPCRSSTVCRITATISSTVGGPAG
jgi:hypothetical protein